MKKVVWSLVLALALFALAPAGNAQTAGNTGTYVVEKDDTLYELANIYLNNATMWRKVLEANPFLKEPGRVFEKEGKIIVLIRPGEKLAGLEELGIYPHVQPFNSLERKPETLQSTPAPPAQAEVSTGGGWLEKLGWGALMLFLFLLALGGFVGLYDHLRRKKELRQNPITSGIPIVAGGVQPNETERLERTMRTAAVSEYVRMNPGVEAHTVRVERIGPIEAGLVSGSGMVGYADRARPRTIDPPQPGYRARFRFPDGREDNLMSLQGCMNPCYYGEGMSGFSFEPTQQVLPTPEPERPAPQPVPHPAFAVRRIREAAQVENQNTIAFGNDVMVFPLGYHLTVDRATNAITLESNAVRMTLNARPNEQTSTGDETATGTTGSEN